MECLYLLYLSDLLSITSHTLSKAAFQHSSFLHRISRSIYRHHLLVQERLEGGQREDRLSHQAQRHPVCLLHVDGHGGHRALLHKPLPHR